MCPSHSRDSGALASGSGRALAAAGGRSAAARVSKGWESFVRLVATKTFMLLATSSAVRRSASCAITCAAPSLVPSCERSLLRKCCWRTGCELTRFDLRVSSSSAAFKTLAMPLPLRIAAGTPARWRCTAILRYVADGRVRYSARRSHCSARAKPSPSAPSSSCRLNETAWSSDARSSPSSQPYRTVSACSPETKSSFGSSVPSSSSHGSLNAVSR
mmetsp:Transcript_21388/g.45414  ORF Transcript_21388/g.45414 Transcript_21388/m.45414 type:complete len:216 (-) Transcript_21388:282-929(-)